MLRTARAVLLRWRDLSAEEQSRVRGQIETLRPLTIELARGLGGARMAKPGKRDASLVLDEVRASLAELGQAAPQLLEGLGPRTRRGKLALKATTGVGGAVLRRASTLRRRAPEDPEGIGDDAELAEVMGEISGAQTGTGDEAHRTGT